MRLSRSGILAWLVVLLVAGGTLSQADDFHVLKDLDGNGNADPCPNAAHQVHYSTDTVECGSTFDIDGDGTAETLYCDIQLAMNAAVNPGDTVEIHEATYVAGDSTTTAIKDLCNSNDLTHDSFVTVKACAACDTEGERRYFRAADMLGDIDVDVVLAPGASSGIESGLTVGTTYFASNRWDFVTLKGLTVDEVDFGSCSGTVYNGVITIHGQVTDLIIDDMTVSYLTTNGECPSSTDGGPSALVVVGTTIAYTERVEIKNSHFDSCLGIVFESLKGGNQECGGGVFRSFVNLDIHDNWLGNHQPGWSAENWKYVYRLAFYNNRMYRTNFGSWRRRQSEGPMWVFNNFIEDGRHFQRDQSACGTVYNFNNTFYNQDQDVFGIALDVGFLQPTGTDLNIFSYSNIYANGPQGFTEAYVDTNLIVSPHTLTIGYEYIDKTNRADLYLYPRGGNVIDVGNIICHDNGACGDNSNVSQCDGSGTGCDITTNKWDMIGSLGTGDADWHLAAGSDLIGAGFNDPLGQGAGVCSITLWPGHVINCAVDFEGDSRGLLWDIGADEFAGTSALLPPPIEVQRGEGVMP